MPTKTLVDCHVHLAALPDGGNGTLLANVAVALSRQGITPTDLRAEQPTLEDVFLTLTKKQVIAARESPISNSNH